MAGPQGRCAARPSDGLAPAGTLAKSPTLGGVAFVAPPRERDRHARTPTFTNWHAMDEATSRQKRAVAALIARTAEPITFDEASRLIRDLKRETHSFPAVVAKIIEADYAGDVERLGRLLANAKRQVRHGDWLPMLRQLDIHLRCIASDPRRAHGLAPVLVLADEPAQWPDTTGEKMVAALRTAAGKQPHSRFVALGTRPADDAHWFSKALTGGADYAQCHAAKPGDPKFNRRTWTKANPSLGQMPDLEAAIRTESAQARRDPSLLASFDALRLNLGTADTEVALLLDASLWADIEGEAERTRPVVWGIDLGTSAAQSAIAAYWPETGRLECIAAFPSEPSLAERGLRDGVSGLYSECARRGELLTLGQRSADVPMLLQAALERFGRPSRIVADRWREAELRDALDGASVPPAALELRGQGYRDGAEDVRSFRRSCADGRVVPVPSLLLRSAMAEARTVSDPAGNAKLCKGSQGGRRLRARDDAAAAAILAVAAGARQPAKPKPRWRYRGAA